MSVQPLGFWSLTSITTFLGRLCSRPEYRVLGIAGFLQGYIQRDNDVHQHWYLVD